MESCPWRWLMAAANLVDRVALASPRFPATSPSSFQDCPSSATMNIYSTSTGPWDLISQPASRGALGAHPRGVDWLSPPQKEPCPALGLPAKPLLSCPSYRNRKSLHTKPGPIHSIKGLSLSPCLVEKPLVHITSKLQNSLPTDQQPAPTWLAAIENRPYFPIRTATPAFRK